MVSPPIIVALDVPDAGRAIDLAQRVAPHVGAFKVGLGLLCGLGPGVVGELARMGPVMVDAKLHDIPVLILTGDPDKLLHQVADQVGAAKVIQKPISAPDLRGEIADMLRLEV